MQYIIMNPFYTMTAMEWNITHNLSAHYLYGIWVNTKSKCLNSKNKYYKYYGARGIKIYEKWITDFKSFFTYIQKEIGLRPSSNYNLDRIDNNKNYEPGNLRWVNKSLSSFNTRKRTTNYRWVTHRKNKYFAQVSYLTKCYYTPHYKTPLQAAITADYLATKLWGNNAKNLVNFPQHWNTYSKIIK